MKYTAPGRRHRLRIGRHSAIGQIYLVTLVTAHRQPWLADFRAARSIVSAMRLRDQVGDTDTLAWVVMPDHVHWLMQLSGTRRLGVVVGSLKSQVARRVDISGRVAMPSAHWQPGFHDRALRKEEDLRAVARYVVANPLRAGLADRIGDYSHWDAVWLIDGPAQDLLS